MSLKSSSSYSAVWIHILCSTGHAAGYDCACRSFIMDRDIAELIFR